MPFYYKEKHKHKKDGSKREETEEETPSCEKQRSLGVVNIISISEFILNRLPSGLRIRKIGVISKMTNKGVDLLI